MRGVVLLSLIASSGCASAHTGTERSATESVRIVGAGNLRMAPRDGAEVTPIALPAERVWDLLPAVFDSLGIPLDNNDQTTHVIGHSGTKVHGKLGTIPLTRIIDCGSTQGFPSAESYDIQISVLTQVKPGEKGMVSLTTTVQAVGRPMAFSGEYVRCSSKGALEKMIADGVKARAK